MHNVKLENSHGNSISKTDDGAEHPAEFKIVGTRPIRPDGIDKVTGRAMFGADMSAPGMLHGAVLRSPHPHARILNIDVSAALAVEGVDAVVTSVDFKKQLNSSKQDTLENLMAHDKVLYQGHAVAAIAASSAALARQAAKLIKVDYKILPHVIDVDDAYRQDAPPVQEGREFPDLPEGSPHNVSDYYEFGHGDLDAGFAKADKVIERTYKTGAAHQGYIEPHACLGTMDSEGRGELWVCTQGHFMVRALCASFLGTNESQLRVTSSEIGGGFGGKTTIYLEPVALALSRKAGRPVKMVMTREEVFMATGPTLSCSMDVKVGMTKKGRITAGLINIRMQSGPYSNGDFALGPMAAFAAYDLEAVNSIGWNVLTNRPKVAAYRAPGAPAAVYAVESIVNELCEEFGLDPLDTRIINAARKGTKSSYGPTFDDVGLIATLEAAKKHPHYTAPLGKNQGRGMSCGFWFNFGGDCSVSLMINADGTVGITEGNPDIGGSRASICMMAAEELGIEYERVRTIIADTNSIGLSEVTNGSRVTFSVGLATIAAARAAKKVMCGRAAKIWDIDEDAVFWEDGCAKPSGPNAGDFPPMTLAEIAGKSSQTGGPIAGHHEGDTDTAGVSFGVHLVDLEVDPDTGFTKILRYTALQDAGKAIHPAYVEGQLQGGSAQGIGWALNEEYIYGEDGKLQNASFLDYRIPVASDLPYIDTVVLEIANPGHPYGVRGVGETPIVPPLAAISNGITAAVGARLYELPMSPPRILAAIQKKNDG